MTCNCNLIIEQTSTFYHLSTFCVIKLYIHKSMQSQVQVPPCCFFPYLYCSSWILLFTLCKWYTKIGTKYVIIFYRHAHEMPPMPLNPSFCIFFFWVGGGGGTWLVYKHDTMEALSSSPFVSSVVICSWLVGSNNCDLKFWIILSLTHTYTSIQIWCTRIVSCCPRSLFQW